MRLCARPQGRVVRISSICSPGSRAAVSGALSELPFSPLAVLRLCSARPQDSSGSDSFVHPFPPLPLLPFLLPLSNYLLVSSPAGRSFFEKTTRARTRPTPPTKNTDPSPIPTGDTRPHSYVFPLRLVYTLDLHLRILSPHYLSSNSHLESRHVPVPNLLPFPVLPIPACISSPFSSHSIQVDLDLFLTSRSF